MMPSTRGSWHTRGTLALILTVLLCTACGPPSEEEIQQEFDEFLAERNHCSAVAECSLIYPGCPLGCAVGVRTEFAPEVNDKADELIDDYESGGRACAYDCMPTTVDCVEGRCEAVPQSL